MSATNDAEDLDLPATERDAVSTGAAADSADWDQRLKGLPRLLRYAILVSDNANHIEQRLRQKSTSFAMYGSTTWPGPRRPAWRRDWPSPQRTRPQRRHPERAEPAQPCRLRPTVVPAAAARCLSLRGLSQGRQGAGPGLSQSRRRCGGTTLLRSRAFRVRLGRGVCRPAPTCCRSIFRLR